MTLHYEDDTVTVHHGDSLDVLREMPAGSVDAVVTDPPYGLADHKPEAVVRALSAWLSGDREAVPEGQKGFMGRSWDGFVPPPALWDECLRAMKPGGALLAFSAPRTADLMGMAIRLAGFQIRDGIDWIFGSGMPKSLDVSKAIDAAAGAEREVVGRHEQARPGRERTARFADTAPARQALSWQYDLTAPATEEAVRWQGWGTGLRPSHECIIVARKPPAGTIASNVLQFGTGAINVDACRVGSPEDKRAAGTKTCAPGRLAGDTSGNGQIQLAPHDGLGRWPANTVYSHSPDCDPEGPCAAGCPVAELDRQSGASVSSDRPRLNTAAAHNRTPSMGSSAADWTSGGHADSGGASRFFPVFRYEAKADASERPRVNGVAHETVKPLALMRWLAKLACPPGGVILDPFLGSGTTAEACIREGFRCVGVEREAKYLPLIDERIRRARRPWEPSKADPRRGEPEPQPSLFDDEGAA